MMIMSEQPSRNLRILRIGSCIILAVFAASCAQNNKKFASAGNKFPPSVYGPASPRVVADGEPVPKGGGSYMVGKPYTVAGKTYYPSESPNYSAIGLASWYGSDFHGRKTANGEVFDSASISAAHPTMPLPSYARVTNLRNQRSIIVRVNDRGPYHGGRVMDVSEKVAEALKFRNVGTTKIKVDYISRAGLSGSDDGMLLASLRTDGTLASLDNTSSQPILTAIKPTFQKIASLLTPSEPVPAAEETVSTNALVAENAQPAPFGALTNTVSAASSEPAPRPSNVPSPPTRPFDLGKVPHAGVQMSALPTVAIPLPPLFRAGKPGAAKGLPAHAPEKITELY